VPTFEEWTKDQPVDEIIGLLAPTGVPCGRVNTPADILRISRAGELDLLEEVADGAGGSIRSPANPFGFRRAPASLPPAGGDGCSVVSEQYPEEAQHLCRGGEVGRDRTSVGQEPQTRTEP
jgi:crotonobetainyl-CoA:carnitine CoA-transferase CaiB-like acyl-CoA transferase